MALAMGAENAVFEREGEVSIGLTYMTGALVKLGQHLVSAYFGGNRWLWTAYLGLWLGQVTGAMAGAMSYARLGLSSLWLASVLAMSLSIAATILPADPVEAF